MTLSFNDYAAFDASELASGMKSGQLDAREVLDAAITRAEAINSRLNAITIWHLDKAADTLKNLDRDAAFAGVPFLLKDLYVFMKGSAQSHGTRLCPPDVAAFDSTFVSRVKRIGLNVFGKTTSPEFGMNVVTEPKKWGPCRNPYNLDRSPGGSSGGAAAAVAAGVVPMAHASDGGGSIRIPASACGLFGFKPSRGLMPTGPVVGEGWNGFASSNVISRTVKDTARFMDLVGTPEAGAPYACPHPAEPFTSELEKPITKRRIALVTKPVVDQSVDPDCLEATRKTASFLEDLGHDVEEATLPIEGAAFEEAFVAIICANAAQDQLAWQAKLGDDYDADRLEAATRAFAEKGYALSATSFLGAIQGIQRGGRLMGQFFERYDAVLSPTMAALPPEIGHVDQDDPDLEQFLARNRPYTAFTALFNAIGSPAVNLPLHQTADGLPVGSMLGAALGRDNLLFELAGQLEKAHPWRQNIPQLNLNNTSG